MTLPITPYGNNPEVPGAWSAGYYPDQLIAGDLKIVTDTVSVSGAAVLKRGTGIDPFSWTVSGLVRVGSS